MVNTNDALGVIKQMIIDHLKSTYKYFALGTGTTPDSSNDTALENEVFRKEITEIEESATSVLFRCYLATTEANGYTLTEFGIFDSASNGRMLFRKVFGGITKTEEIEVWFELEEVVDVA